MYDAWNVMQSIQSLYTFKAQVISIITVRQLKSSTKDIIIFID